MQASNEVCPYCGKPMEAGNLIGRNGMYFLPRFKDPPRINTKRAMEKAGAIRLATMYFKDASLIIGYPSGHLCRHCEKIIIDYEP